MIYLSEGCYKFLTNMNSNLGQFDGTGKFMDFINFNSFGGDIEANLMYTETN